MDAAAMTTDQIADAIRQRIVANPVAVITCAPGVQELATIISQRLPYIATDDVGAVLMHIGCYMADATQILRGIGGMSAHTASEMVNNIITLAGEQLYTTGQRAARDRRSNGPGTAG